MYRIIGADQKEYGPVSAEQLRQWLAQGRVHRQTKVKAEGATDWQTLGDLPEFMGESGASPGAPRPAIPGQAPGQTGPSTTSGMAITSMVLGILGFCGITAVIGLILGIVALVRINKSQGRLTGSGLAIAGICLSGLMMIMGIPIMAAMLLPALAKAKSRAQAITCVNNVKQLELAMLMSANANTNLFPTGTNWCDEIKTYVGSPRTFLCVAGNPGDRCHYAYNAALSGLDMNTVKNPSTTVMIFESKGGWNQSGGTELLTQTRHPRTTVVGFADGHVEMVPDWRLPQLNWTP